MKVVDDCVPGKGKDYQVGPGTGQLASLDLVPWEKLAAGDTVRIFYSDKPYRGKFMITSSGTASAPIRICGVKNAAGVRPIIDGDKATTRKSLVYGNMIVHQTRSIIVLKQIDNDWYSFPSYIQIDGLEIRGATKDKTFTDAAGVVRNYTFDPTADPKEYPDYLTNFGACIWIDRGHNITIADNVIHDCTNGIFSKSTNDGDFAVTKNIRIAGNYIYGNGVVGDVHEHNTYTQSVNITYEFNRIEALRSGAPGNAIKDRSVGTVVRYNYVNGGAHAVDLVEAEDFQTIALADPAYRSTHVYGNIITKSGDTGSVVHYGGDHYGSKPGLTWGEPIYRKGTLYFYNNTVSIAGSSVQMFQLSTTEERAEVWNNVFYFASTIKIPCWRTMTDGINPLTYFYAYQIKVETPPWTSGGILNLGKNWASSTVADSDPDHPVLGSLLGVANLVKGTTLPLDGGTYIPLSGSAIVDTAQAVPVAVANAVAAHPVQYQFDLATMKGKTRVTTGAGADIGAVER